MKYWRLFTSAEKKEIGSFPQVIEPIIKGQFIQTDLLWNKYLRKIDSSTVIPKGHLDKKAKLTDLMSVGFGAGDLFVSDKLRNILEQFKVDAVQFADSEVITNNGERIKSNIMHPFESDYRFLDFNKTEFIYSDYLYKEIYDTVKFDTVEDFLNARQKCVSENSLIEDITKQKMLAISKISIAENIEYGFFSIFNLTYAGFGFFVSQKLKDHIEEEKCTGVIFREVNEKYP